MFTKVFYLQKKQKNYMDNYYELKDRESFSSLSALASGPQEYLKYLEREDDENIPEYFLKGKIVDDLRCLPVINQYTVEDYFAENYIINTLETPSGQDLTLANYLIENFSIEEIDKSALLNSISTLKIYNNIKKEDTLLSKYEGIEEYVSFYLNAKASGSPIISFDLYTVCKNIIFGFLADPQTSIYMSNESSGDVEIINEMPILWSIKRNPDIEVLMKSKLDKVIIDHKNQTIQPIDFKTTSSPTDSFKSSYIKYKYYYQAGLYSPAIIYKQLKEEWCKGYKLLDFLFIVGNGVDKPLVYSVPESQVQAAFSLGGKIGFSQIKPVIDLLDDLLWYKENGFDTEKNYCLNGNYEIKVIE